MLLQNLKKIRKTDIVTLLLSMFVFILAIQGISLYFQMQSSIELHASMLAHAAGGAREESILAKEEFWQGEFLTLFLPKIFILLIYITLATTIYRLFAYGQKKYEQTLDKYSDVSSRAEHALSCIDEVVITTTMNGRIIFCNASAEQWLGNKTVDSVIGKSIQKIFSFSGLPWLDRWSRVNENGQYKSHGETLVDFNGRILTLDISQHFAKMNGESATITWVLRDITRQAADRELLDNSRTRYQALYEGSGLGIWHVDISLVRAWLGNLNGLSVKEHLEIYPEEYSDLLSCFHLMDINKAALGLHGGRSKQEFIANVVQLFEGYNKQPLIDFSQQIFEGKTKFSLELEFKGIEKVSRHYLLDTTLDVVGEDQALLSFVDINDRIHAEQALKRSEKFWAGVIETLPDTVYVNDLINKHTIYNNRHIGELLGYNKNECKNIQHWRELLHKDDLPATDKAIKHLRKMEPGEVNETVARLKHRDGSWRVMRFRDCIFTQPDEEFSRYYVGTARDITEKEDAEFQLNDNERRYRLLAEGMSDIVFTLDTNLNLSYISSSVKKMLGYDASQVMREGLGLIFNGNAERLFIDSVQIDLVNSINKRAMDRVRSIDLRTQRQDGLPITLEIQSNLLRNEANEVEGVLATCRDVTSRRYIEQEARTASEVFENSSEAILVLSPKGKINKVNKAFTHLTDFSACMVMNTLPMVRLIPDVTEDMFGDIRDALLIEGYWQGEINYRNKAKEIRPSWTGITALKDQLGKVQSYIIIASDISDRKLTEARIEKLAYFDPLTGLPNRSQMHETLDRLMLEDDQLLALLFIDLDRFKPINDTMGHPVGDLVLKEVAQRLRLAIRESDLVARIGGDEFTVIMPSLENTELAITQAINVSEHILHQMMQPFEIEERQLYLSASVGIALFPQNASSGMDLLRNADTAMYYAKAMGKNNFQFYAEEMNIRAMERLELENNLHLALRRNEFELYYQAQWDTKNNKLCGIEALLRWHRPSFGLVGPDKFIPVIEETGLIVPIGEWVLRAACEQIIEWQEAGFVVPKLSVNISARQFKDAKMLDSICHIVDETGVDPELIELELTESILMDDVDRTLAVLNEARKMGFHLSIDDFGTGYSSLSYLKQFPVNNLKIDQSFIRNLPNNQADAQITRTIVAMANNLGLGVIAEGVENEAQRRFLQEVGCYQVQGYMYSKPVCADILAHDFLEAEHEMLSE